MSDLPYLNGKIIVRPFTHNEKKFIIFKVNYTTFNNITNSVFAVGYDCISQDGNIRSGRKGLVHILIKTDLKELWRLPTEGELDMYNKVFNKPEEFSQSESDKEHLKRLNKVLSTKFDGGVKLFNPVWQGWRAITEESINSSLTSKLIGLIDSASLTNKPSDIDVFSVDLETNCNPLIYKNPITTYGRIMEAHNVGVKLNLESYINNFAVEDTTKSKEIIIPTELNTMFKIPDLTYSSKRTKQKFTPEYKCRWK